MQLSLIQSVMMEVIPKSLPPVISSYPTSCPSSCGPYIIITWTSRKPIMSWLCMPRIQG